MGCPKGHQISLFFLFMKAAGDFSEFQIIGRAPWEQVGKIEELQRKIDWTLHRKRNVYFEFELFLNEDDWKAPGLLVNIVNTILKEALTILNAYISNIRGRFKVIPHKLIFDATLKCMADLDSFDSYRKEHGFELSLETIKHPSWQKHSKDMDEYRNTFNENESCQRRHSV